VRKLRPTEVTGTIGADQMIDQRKIKQVVLAEINPIAQLGEEKGCRVSPAKHCWWERE
jgi:hypothetical protein